MDIAEKKDDLKVEVSHKQILSIALPITLAILVPQINMLTNSIFLGRLSNVALGNAGITGVFYLIFAVAGNGLNNAMQTVFSKNAGSGHTGNFKVILSQGIRISIQFSIICIAFTWLLAPYVLATVADPSALPEEIDFLKIRILGLPFLYLFQMGNAFLVASLNSRFLLIGFICEALVNVVFDYLLIFGKFGFPALGFKGAAVASVIAECSGLIVVLLVLAGTGIQKKYALFSTFQYNKKTSLDILTVSVPLVAQYIISVTTWLIFFLLIESRGAMAKAISNVMRNVFGLAGIFIWAFSAATNNMVANLCGQQQYKKVLPAIYMIMLWSAGLCGIMVGILNIFPSAFFDLFGQSEAFTKEGISVIRMVSLGMVLMSIANIWLNSITGTGKTKINLIIEIVAICLYLCYTWYFMRVKYISLAVAWSNEFVYWAAIFIMSFLFMRSKKWLPSNINHT